MGAGSSGIASCQVLQERGIPFDCFEKGSGVGGNWRYGNDNGMSSAYRSLFINTSRRLMAYASYPMPDEYPDYPHHSQIAAYFDDYVDHFGFRDRIRFNAEVKSIEPVDGEWEVTLDDGTTQRYGAVFVASGHHWDAKWPEPPFPGEFGGEVLHSHYYREPDERFVDKNVLVLGIGNSATDIAVETSRVSQDDLPRDAPRRLGDPQVHEGPAHRRARHRALEPAPVGGAAPDVQAAGRPGPGLHGGLRPAEARPQDRRGAPHDLLGPAAADRPRADQAQGQHRAARGPPRSLQPTGGARSTPSYCTGYKITFPFLAPPEVIDTAHNRVPLYRRVVHPDRPGLYFIGLVQPLGAIMPIAEAQSEWIADVLEGKVELPAADEMKRVIEREDERMRKRYVASTRHTIQVDFYPYLRTIARAARRRGRAPGPRYEVRRSHDLRLPRTRLPRLRQTEETVTSGDSGSSGHGPDAGRQERRGRKAASRSATRPPAR